MFLGRLGYGVTIVFAMPLVLLPNREALLSLPDQWKKLTEVVKNMNLTGHTASTVDFDEETPLNKDSGSNGSNNCYTETNEFLPIQSKKLIAPPEIKTLPAMNLELQSSKFLENVLHFASSILLVTICFFGAVAVPGVAIVWSIIGSSNAIILAFILPSMCYIKIQGNIDWTPMMIGTWALLIFAIVAAFVCTIQTIRDL